MGQIGRALTAAKAAQPMRPTWPPRIFTAGDQAHSLVLDAEMLPRSRALAGRADATGLGAVGVVAMDLADIATNETSLLNKGMDATAMGVGATIGGILGGPAAPLTAMYGASIGKAASDGLQFLFGDKKSPKQRELENALSQLNAGRIG